MKLKQHVYNSDGHYQWQTDYLGCRLTFSDDLQRLQIQKIDGDEIGGEYELWDFCQHDERNGYYDWRLSTTGDLSIARNWDDEWKPVISMGECYLTANNRDLWNEGPDQDGHTTDEEWENGTVAERILFMHECGMLEEVFNQAEDTL